MNEATQLLRAADALVVTLSGIQDWRPLFVLGLETLVFIVAFALLVYATLRRLH